MSWGSDALWRLASSHKQSTTLCRSCLFYLRHSQRRQATTASSPIASVAIDTKPSGQTPPFPAASKAHAPSYKFKASVLLSRPPLLTRDLTPFEKAYFLYQRRLNERLALPFTRYFYYQKGTPGDVEWKRKIKGRLAATRDIGRYSGYGEEAWNDEVLVNDKVSEPEEQIQALLRDAEDKEGLRSASRAGKRDEAIERPLGRRTEADATTDLRSLNRLLTRTLYLVVKRRDAGLNKTSGWTWPEGVLKGNESLHTAAERIIVQAGGVNMNTWVVGNVPISHQVFNYPRAIIDKNAETETRGEKTFYLKARIMAGQANLKENNFDLEDFRWLAKEELQDAIYPREFAAVRNVLADR